MKATNSLASTLEQLSTIHFDEIEGEFTIQELWEWILFDQDNNHLNEDLEIHEPSGVPIKGRTTELDQKLILTGDYYCFTYIDHQPSYHLQKVKSPDELVHMILSESGINNSFTTVITTIIKGEIQPFYQKEPTTYKELNLIYEIQKIVSQLNDSNFDELTKRGYDCLVKCKTEGLSQQDTYDTVYYVAKVYQALALDYKNDLVDELLDYISGYIGNKSRWIWDQPL